MTGQTDRVLGYIADTLPDKIHGADGDKYKTISVTNDTTFKAAYSGWLVCTLTTNNSVSLAPYASLDAYKASGSQTGIVSSIWGITANGATLTVQGPIKKGCKYRVHAVRCSIASTRVFV